MRVFSALAAVLLAFLIVGCGGAGNGSANTATLIKIHWPARSRVIPTAANSVRLVAYLNSAVAGNEIQNVTYQVGANATSTTSALANRPADFGASVTNIKITNLPETTGTDQIVLEAVAFDQAGGLGTIVARGTVNVLVVAGQQTPFDISMSTTILDVRATVAAYHGHLQTAFWGGATIPIDLGFNPQITFAGVDAIGGNAVVPWANADLKIVATSPVSLGAGQTTVTGQTLTKVATVNDADGTITVSDTQAGVVPPSTFTIHPLKHAFVAQPPFTQSGLHLNDLAVNGTQVYGLFYDDTPAALHSNTAYAELTGGSFGPVQDLLTGNDYADNTGLTGRLAVGDAGNPANLFASRLSPTSLVDRIAPSNWGAPVAFADDVLDVASAPSEPVYILDDFPLRVFAYDQTAGTLLGGTALISTGLNISGPANLALGTDLKAGTRVFYVSYGTGPTATVRRYSSTGVLDSSFHFGAVTSGITDIAADGANLYVLDSASQKIWIYSWDGSQVDSISLSLGGAQATRLVAQGGVLYVGTQNGATGGVLPLQ